MVARDKTDRLQNTGLCSLTLPPSSDARSSVTSIPPVPDMVGSLPVRSHLAAAMAAAESAGLLTTEWNLGIAAGGSSLALSVFFFFLKMLKMLSFLRPVGCDQGLRT